jgi:predicted DNA-binding transcriptional regulator
MNYKQESLKIIEELLRESWMDDSDWNLYLLLVQSSSGITIDTLARELEEAVKNGYSIEAVKASLKTTQ